VRIVRLLFVLGILGPAAPLAAQRQWGVALEVGQVSFDGHAKSTVPPETSGHPSSASIWGLRLDRNGPRIGFGVGILAASTGVEFESDEAAAEARDVLDLFEIAPEISVVILKPRETAVRLHAGAVLDRWSPHGDVARTALGGLGAISIDVPFSSRISVTVRWQVAATGSVFNEEELPPDFSRKSGRSTRWIVGGRFGL
jgi:hypothetical protein